MEYKNYLARVEFDEDADVFHGEIINIRDVVTFQGKSVAELRQAFVDSVDDYFAFCAACDEQPDQPFTGRFIISLTPEQHRKVILMAEKSRDCVENWVANTLEKAVAMEVCCCRICLQIKLVTKFL